MNTPTIKKNKVFSIFLTVMIMCSKTTLAGLWISGPTCVQSGSTQYSYNIGVSTPTTWNGMTTMNWSTNGGSSFVNGCCGQPKPTVTLTFSGTQSSVVITLNSSIGIVTLTVTVTTPVAGGTISPVTQTVDNQIPATLSVTGAGGGACAPS